MERVTARPVEASADGRTFYEVEPYQETELSGGWVVYHQGDEEQTAIVHGNGQVELRGPHDWVVSYEVPV